MHSACKALGVETAACQCFEVVVDQRQTGVHDSSVKEPEGRERSPLGCLDVHNACRAEEWPSDSLGMPYKLGEECSREVDKREGDDEGEVDHTPVKGQQCSWEHQASVIWSPPAPWIDR